MMRSRLFCLRPCITIFLISSCVFFQFKTKAIKTSTPQTQELYSEQRPADRYFIPVTINYLTLPVRAEVHVIPESENTHITIGDMHANLLTIINLLVIAGVIEITNKQQYWQISNLVKKTSSISPARIGRPGGESGVPLTKSDYVYFERLLESTFKVIEQKKRPFIRFLGDILADRTSNDLLTLEFFTYLFLNNVKLEIIYSNHDEHFFHILNEGKWEKDPYNIYQSLSKSLVTIWCDVLSDQFNMCSKSNDRSFIDYINETVETYRDHLKLIAFDEKTKHIYSHAPLSKGFYSCIQSFHESTPHFSRPDKPDIESLKSMAEDVNRKFIGLMKTLPVFPLPAEENASPKHKVLTEHDAGVSSAVTQPSAEYKHIFGLSAAGLLTPCSMLLWAEPNAADLALRGIHELGGYSLDPLPGVLNVHGHTQRIRTGADSGLDATLDSDVGKKSFETRTLKIEVWKSEPSI